jgi:hypothetical protein
MDFASAGVGARGIDPDKSEIINYTCTCKIIKF